MIDHTALHAELAVYCASIGIKPSSFGQLLFGQARFADSLQRGTASIGKAAEAARFMAEHPDVPHRAFGAAVRAWRDRVTAEAAAEGGAGHEGLDGDGGASTAATLAKPDDLHNQESQPEPAR